MEMVMVMVNGGGVSESKSGDSSLRDWFGKSKSSDGKPGWVQLGGKYAGKPCAKQPGQTTKPKCGSSKNETQSLKMRSKQRFVERMQKIQIQIDQGRQLT